MPRKSTYTMLLLRGLIWGKKPFDPWKNRLGGPFAVQNGNFRQSPDNPSNLIFAKAPLDNVEKRNSCLDGN